MTAARAWAVPLVIGAALALAACAGPVSPPVSLPEGTPTVSRSAPPEPTAVTETTAPPTVDVPAAGYSIQLGAGATPDDAALAAAFVELALNPSSAPDGLTFAADGVQLGVMDRIFATRSPGELQDRSAWEVGSPDDLSFESQGPYSALEPVRTWVVGQVPEEDVPLATGVFEVAVGRHDGCPYAIEGVPPGMEQARQVWLTSVGDLVSCAAGWFAVDLFVVDDAVAAVTVELGSP